MDEVKKDNEMVVTLRNCPFISMISCSILEMDEGAKVGVICRDWEHKQIR